MEPNPRTALVDESFRRGVDGRGYALLVAVIVPDVAAAEIERDLRQLVYAGQRRFHWRDERPASRRKFMSKVAEFDELDVVALAYCQETPSQRKVQQARVRSIWTLLADLAERHVGTLVFESRQERNDVKDRREVLAAQQAGVADRDLVYRHGRPKEEPLLWLADAIAGGVGEKMRGRTATSSSCSQTGCGRSAGSTVSRQREGRGPVFRRGFPASLPTAYRRRHS